MVGSRCPVCIVCVRVCVCVYGCNIVCMLIACVYVSCMFVCTHFFGAVLIFLGSGVISGTNLSGALLTLDDNLDVVLSASFKFSKML